MGKNISIYVPDDLAKEMDRFPEVNWSEIARTGIEDYINGRERPEQMMRKLDDFSFRLEEVKRLRNELIHKIGTVSIRGTDKIIIKPKAPFLIGKQYPQVRLVFEISNPEYGSNVIFDRLFYDLDVFVQGKSITKISGNYLEKKEIPFGGRKVELNTKNNITAEVCHQIHEIAKKDESDVTWIIDGKAFFEGSDGTLVTVFGATKEMAFSHWKKWYLRWVEACGQKM